MKNYIWILCLSTISFINCSDSDSLSLPSKLEKEGYSLLLLSPSKLEKEDHSVRRALEHLSPLKGQTIKEAHDFYLETYAKSPYNRVYLTKQQEEDEIRKIEEAYEFLRSRGFKDATRDDIESSFIEQPDLLNLSFFSSQRLSSITSPASHSCSSILSSSSSLSSRSEELSIASSLEKKEDHKRKNMFKNEDDVWEWLGLKPNQEIDKAMMEIIAFRISQLDFSNAIGEVTDEDFCIARQFRMKLETQLKK